MHLTSIIRAEGEGWRSRGRSGIGLRQLVHTGWPACTSRWSRETRASRAWLASVLGRGRGGARAAAGALVAPTVNNWPAEANRNAGGGGRRALALRKEGPLKARQRRTGQGKGLACTFG